MNVSSSLENLSRIKVLVIGDVMLDHYIHGQVRRISPEAPVPIVEEKDEAFVLGGASNVAHNLCSLGVRVSMASVIGVDTVGQKLLNLIQDRGISSDLIVADKNRPTTIKTRIIAHNQQMLRIDREKTSPLEGNIEEQFFNRLKEAWSLFDAVILSDYAKGVLSFGLLDRLRELSQQHKKIVCVDPKYKDFTPYRGFSLITPNQSEAEQALGVSFEDKDHFFKRAMQVQKELAIEAMLITLGKKGMALVRDNQIHEIPTRAREVYDVTGAGDTVIAVLTACLACQTSLPEAAFLANAAAGLVVGKLGAATVTREELLCSLQ